MDEENYFDIERVLKKDMSIFEGIKGTEREKSQNSILPKYIEL